MAARVAWGVAEGDLAEAGREGAEAAFVLGLGRKAYDCDGASVEVIGGDEDLRGASPRL